MNVHQMPVCATKAVITLLDHSNASAMLVTHYQMMGWHAEISMSACWGYISVSRTVSILMVDSGVNVLLATPSILT